MLRLLYITALFLITNAVIIYFSLLTQSHLDNVADASCYEGRIVYLPGED